MASPNPSTAAGGDFVSILTCPVCLDAYREPKTLNCLHSFCTPCLEKCRKPYRREIACPVCKNTTVLSAQGVKGLKADFRVQQIKEFLEQQKTSDNSANSEETLMDTKPSAIAAPAGKSCTLCETEGKMTTATHHCTDCVLYYCQICLSKHSQNTLFTQHQVLSLSTATDPDTLYCQTHKEQSVKFFCKECAQMLCTICVFQHSPDHQPTPFEKGLIQKYQGEMKENARKLKSKISEADSKIKYLETVKQSHQRYLYEAQRSIRNKAAELIERVKEEEKILLQDVQCRASNKLKEIGSDLLGEMSFQKLFMESLHTELEENAKASAVDCLAKHDDLIVRARSTLDVTLPSLHVAKVNSTVKFAPAEDSVCALLGELRECTISQKGTDMSEVDGDRSSCLSPTRPLSPLSPRSPRSPSSPRPQRIHSILNALSSKRTDVKKIGKVKAFNNLEPPKSPNSINADELLTPEASGSASDELQRPSTSLLDTPPASPSNEEAANALATKPKLMYKVDQVGGWPGKISSPTSLAFLPDGSIIVAECENRLQVFNEVGQSVKVLGWGKIRPQCVIVTNNRKIMVTDKKDACVKVFGLEGEQIGAWGQGLFSQPSGISQMSNGNLVITDVDKNMVSIHSSDGSLITQFGSWGSGDYQFNGPVYVTVGHQDNIIVSDSCNNCIKLYDHTGCFLRKISGTGGAHGGLRRPQGLCTDLQGNIFVADHDNHRVCMFSWSGMFIRIVAVKGDGIKYPCDIKVRNEELVVVETHNGFLAKDPHHAVKKFIIRAI